MSNVQQNPKPQCPKNWDFEYWGLIGVWSLVIGFFRNTRYPIPDTRDKNGFTLLELIVVVAIFAVISALGIQPLLALKNKNALIRAAEEGASLLAEARARTLSSKNASRYGARFAPDRMVLFRGDSFSANDPENETVFLKPALESPLVSLNGGGVDVVFKRLTGETDEYGTIVFRLKKNPDVTRTIAVGRTGVVSVE